MFFLLGSCNNVDYIKKIEGKQIPIDTSYAVDAEIEQFIKPFRDHVNKDLDSVIAYSADSYSKTQGRLNTALGNLMVDAMYEQANPVFRSRTGRDLDMALLNHGGIRADLPKGPVTARTGFELMPFENSIVVASLKGKYVKDMITYLLRANRAHPISKLNIVIDKDYNVLEAAIKGKEIMDDRSYFVATSDYLYAGGGKMDFFQKSDTLYDLNYKIRNALIDFFRKKDTLNPTIDDRFIQIK
jgi:2',3'-cyclic-nucleotide 2'-phosphodiesterase (5'-nucleotidase family)